MSPKTATLATTRADLPLCSPESAAVRAPFGAAAAGLESNGARS
jgi:hypothetical protein